MRIVHTTVFADGRGGGNPCPVVFDADDLATEEMQAIAGDLGHETAFVLSPRDAADVRLRYFVPRHEMEMCVHATVAVAVLLGSGIAAVETPLGVRGVTVIGDTAEVEQSPPSFGPPIENLSPVLAALGIDAVAGPVQSVSTARAKLMVPLDSEATLDALTPDIPLLWQVCDELDVTGFYPYTEDASGADAAARQFPRDAGYDEDPATGVAACALGALLTDRSARTSSWTIAQGRAMSRPSIITARADHDGRSVTATRVGGHAIRDR